MSIRKLLLFITVYMCFSTASLFADSDEAIRLYYQEEYEEALEMLEPLFQDDPGSNHLYNYYLNTLLELERYEYARSELADLYEEHPDRSAFAVDIGYIYLTEGKEALAEEQFQEILDNLSGREEDIKTTGNAFQRRNETKWAIKIYEKGRTLRNEENPFKYQLAELYQSANDHEKMFTEYLNILDENTEYKANVQNNIQELVLEDEPFETFRSQLISRVQASPGNTAYTDMLSWLFIQREDYREAFRQLRAIDLRLDEDGKRLLDLAQVTVDNSAFGIAEEIYDHIVEMGETGRHYAEARQGLLDVKFERLKEGQPDQEAIDEIEQAYQDHVDEFGLQYRGAGAIFRRLGEIKAVYQDRPREAIDILQDYMDNGRGDATEIARAKLDQARYHTMLGETWRATLLYGQAEKDFKDHPIGHEAKFNNAKLSFYRGEFQWARTQLEVLKGATSDVIANDALQLSLVIKDATGLDTTTEPLKLYAEADLLIVRRNYTEAMETLDRLEARFPDHELSDNILMARADIMMKQRNFEEALTYYEKVYENHPDGILADEAVYRAARLHIDRFDDKNKGVEYLETLLFDFPDSFFTVDARREYRALRGELP